jgi:hypothetical protein
MPKLHEWDWNVNNSKSEAKRDILKIGGVSPSYWMVVWKEVFSETQKLLTHVPRAALLFS